VFNGSSFYSPKKEIKNPANLRPTRIRKKFELNNIVF